MQEEEEGGEETSSHLASSAGSDASDCMLASSGRNYTLQQLGTGGYNDNNNNTNEGAAPIINTPPPPLHWYGAPGPTTNECEGDVDFQLMDSPHQQHMAAASNSPDDSGYVTQEQITPQGRRGCSRTTTAANEVDTPLPLPLLTNTTGDGDGVAGAISDGVDVGGARGRQGWETRVENGNHGNQKSRPVYLKGVNCEEREGEGEGEEPPCYVPVSSPPITPKQRHK